MKDQAYQHQLKEERHERKQAELHWNCPFFRHYWNEGLKLPTRHDCPEYSNQYREYRQSQTNRRTIHAQDAYHHNNMDRHLKNESVHDRLGKESLDRTRLIMKRKTLKEDTRGRKATSAQEI